MVFVSSRPPYPRSRLDFQLVKVFLPANYTGRVPGFGLPRCTIFQGTLRAVTAARYFIGKPFSVVGRLPTTTGQITSTIVKVILSSRGGKREPFNPPFPLAGQAATEFSPILSRIAASDGSSLFYVFDEIISKERGRVEEREK